MKGTRLAPFRCTPLMVPKIWGGEKLTQKFNKPISNNKIGESWEVADLEEGQSYVARGDFKGKSLGEMVLLFGSDLIGTATSLERFPLLIKFLDANDDLSVQVHPGEASARLFEGAISKDECWIILDSENGEIAHGVKPNTTANDIRDAISEHRCEHLLNTISVQEGDAIHVPPGTIHAIRKGVVLLEIQEPSDSTFRLYDYGRKNENGELRDLHVEQALQVLNLNSHTQLIRLKNETHSLLFSPASYRVEVLFVKNATWSVSVQSPQVLINLGIHDILIEDLTLSPFQSAIIPANVNSVTIRSKGKNRIVLAGVTGVLANDLQVS